MYTLNDLGFIVAGCAANVSAALDLIARETIDGASKLQRDLGCVAGGPSEQRPGTRPESSTLTPPQTWIHSELAIAISQTARYGSPMTASPRDEVPTPRTLNWL